MKKFLGNFLMIFFVQVLDFAYNKSKCLALHVLCINFSEEEARDDIKKLPILPTRTLKEHPSISYW
jgi:hypothetical protein